MIEVVHWRRKLRTRSLLERLLCWPWRPFRQIPWVSYIKERKRVRLTPSWDFASTLPSPSETAAADAYRALGALIVARAAPGIIAAEFLVGGRYLHDYQSCTGLSPSEAAAEIGHAIPAHWRP